MKKKMQLLMSWLLFLVMTLNLLSPPREVYAALNVEPLTDFTSQVRQSGVEIQEGGTLKNDESISVEISFGVPVLGDEPEPANPVQKGDSISIELSESFKLISSHNIPLKMGDILVGHVNFTTDPSTQMVVANVIFDGDDEVFDGTSNTVKCRFEASFEYDGSGQAGEEGDHVVSMLEKTFTVHIPPAEIFYEVTKSGNLDLQSKTIQWTVDLSAKQGGADISLEGYQFFDDLSTVGEYIPNSFTVDGVSDTPIIEGDSIRYSFPGNAQSPQTITFETAIPDNLYYSSDSQSIVNRAQLQDSMNTVLAEDEYPVSFTPQWIEKEGAPSDSGSSGVYDPKNRTITWTITANHMEATLNNVVITDVLPNGLTFQSANLKTWDGTGWQDWTAISPNEAGEYELGTIDSKILLTIVTSVPDDDYTTGTKSFKNSAKIRWDGSPGEIATDPIEVGIGYNAIGKSGVTNTSTRSVKWTVTVDTRTQAIPDLKVYDLLVYGDRTSGFHYSQTTGLPAGIENELYPQFDQKYIDGSFSGTGLNITVHPVIQDGKVVADLLEITGFKNDSLNTFTFDTMVVNPDVFAGNKTSDVWNVASLYSANTKLNEATDRVDYTSKLLSKEMLDSSATSNPAAGVNSAITKNANEGFNYVDKSVIFRLSINADGFDLTNMTNALGQSLGAATVTDTLPEGWEFEEIIPGSNFLIFEGTSGSSRTVQGVDSIADTVVGLNASISGREATFTFDTLDKPYVILLKAKPTSETVSEYFNANKTTTVRNNLKLSTANWTPGVSSYQDVTIRSKLLEKTLDKPHAGELLWTVDYKAYDLPQGCTKLNDTLPAGIDLRLDSKGELILSDNNISIHELTLKADGSYVLGNEVALVNNGNVLYDNASRVLTFRIPDSTKSYRFSYITDITGDPGTISNTVSLHSGDGKQEQTGHPYVITTADGEATLQRNGWIIITKEDGSGATLSGAEFTLFASDGKTVIRKGITGSNGTLRFRVIPDGNYILKETMAPLGYTKDNKTHTLSVTTTGSTVVSSINGKTGKGSNAITVQNYLAGIAGDLTITKTVAGNAADKTKKFDFTVTFVGANGTYNYIGSGVPDGTIKSGDTVSLAHGESITIMKLPKDISYTVREADYSNEDYSTTTTGDKGTILADTVQTASFVNTKSAGSLTIVKSVTGNAADKTKKFDFTVTFVGANGTYDYIGSGVPNGTIKSGDRISLAHGESITIMKLPKGISYTVSEADYSSEDYSTTSTGEKGTILADSPQTASFVNGKNKKPTGGGSGGGSTGELTISKTVVGAGKDMDKKFKFNVTFKGSSDSYQYTGNGVSGGTIQSGDTISLAHGESITITGLPENLEYQVKEIMDSAQGYSVESTGESGTISSKKDRTAAFTNTKIAESTGSLRIKKKVTGEGGDLSQKFDFRVTFDGASEAYPYTGDRNGTLRSGDMISLAHGESITITGLPEGTKYSVTEADYTEQGYYPSATGAKGTVSVNRVQEASFNNRWSETPIESEIPMEPEIPKGPEVPTDPNKPTDPKAPAEGETLENIGDGGVPTGFMEDDGRKDMPKTGDNQVGNFGRQGLVLFSLALAAISTSYYVIRKKQS
ncbi:DUF7601 domain-containing protein [Anaerotignum sp. MB30-C6]|uniref:DUF7601 domain-containing protein n=1 Tax=Anaerotignum sp. MB30-C6 TaxID=3070814 RepID=UPI0027DE69BA|nr:DUF5979 domain-containing protein [Anaerotignum sp. MB30-C6]WMI80005.1 DUF5979 domain-containing protein [Anaerotignum sp. MB30-C6]